MKCSNCSEDAVIEVSWKDKRYCPNHFRRYFLAQVGKVINKYGVEGKIAVGLSGGKDSSTCLEVLTHFSGTEIKPFYIDLGIGEFSKESLRAAEELTDKFDLELEVVDLKEEYGTTVPEVNEREGGKACGLCGTIKRYLMNRHAHEHGFDYVATGHNLSDEVSSIFNNLANVYLTPFRGLKPVLKEYAEYNLVAKVKPLYFLKDDECRVYAETNGVSFTHQKCPLSAGSPTNDLKDWLHELDSKRPGILRNFAKSFIRIEERMEGNHGELKRCRNCGYPTATEVCRFCRITGETS